MQRHWSPTARLLVGAAGSALAVYGASRRCDAIGTASGLLGVGLLGRALTNPEMKRLVGVGGGCEAVDLQSTGGGAGPRIGDDTRRQSEATDG